MIRKNQKDWKPEHLTPEEGQDLQTSDTILKKRQSPSNNCQNFPLEIENQQEEGHPLISSTLDSLFKKGRSILSNGRTESQNLSFIELLERIEDNSIREEEELVLLDNSLLQKSEKEFQPVLGLSDKASRGSVYKILERPGLIFKSLSESKL